MNIILNLFLAVLPSFLQRLLRNFLGAEIDSSARISMFSYVSCNNLKMEKNSSINSFVYLRSKNVTLKENAKIRWLTMIKVRTLEVGVSASIDPLVLVQCDEGPRSKLIIGKFSRVFSFAFLEPSHGIFIGEHVAVGHQSSVFCHGSWPNYLDGGPYATGPVKIEDDAWLSSRTMALPNVTIGKRAVVGSHSLVRDSVPEGALFSGVPAKMVSEKFWVTLTENEQEERLQEILNSFNDFHEGFYEKTFQFFNLNSLDQNRQDFEKITLLYSFQRVEEANIARIVQLCNNIAVIDFESRIVYIPENKRQLRFLKLMLNHISSYGVRLSKQYL